MNTHTMIPHRLFVAALSDGRQTPAPQSCPPLPLHVESAATSATSSLEEKRRSEAVSAIALRQVFELGSRYGV